MEVQDHVTAESALQGAAIKKKKKELTLCMGVLPACLSVYIVHDQCPEKPGDVRSPVNGVTDRQLCVMMWVLGIKPRSSTRRNNELDSLLYLQILN